MEHLSFEYMELLIFCFVLLCSMFAESHFFLVVKWSLLDLTVNVLLKYQKD